MGERESASYLPRLLLATIRVLVGPNVGATFMTGSLLER